MTDTNSKAQVTDDLVERIVIDMHYADGDPCTVKWKNQPGKYRASLRRDVRDVLASMSRLGIFSPAPSMTPTTQPATDVGGELVEYFERQIVWSRATFGPALRTKGVIDHIRKELREIEQKPHDLSEWVDVVILAMDGFWRHGGRASDLLPALVAKQQKNMARTWPDWRGMSEDSAIEHDRSKDLTTPEDQQ